MQSQTDLFPSTPSVARPRPYLCHEVRTAEPGDIAAANSLWMVRRKQTRIPDTSEEALAALRERKIDKDPKPFTLAEIRGLLGHPDERVVIAALESDLIPSSLNTYAATTLAIRIWEDADAGRVWSPMADAAFSGHGLYFPTGKQAHAWADSERRSIPTPRTVTDTADAIGAVLVHASDEDRIKALGYESWFVGRGFGRMFQELGAAPFSERVFEFILADPWTVLRLHLPLQAMLSPDHLNRLAAWAAGPIARVATTNEASNAYHTALALFRTWPPGMRFPPETIDELLGALERSPSEKAHQAVAEQLATANPRIFSTVQLDRITALAGESLGHSASALARAKNTPLDTLVRLARSASLPSVRCDLAFRLRDYPDPELTQILSKSRDKVVMARIIAFGVGPGRDRVLARCAQNSDLLRDALWAAVGHVRGDEKQPRTPNRLDRPATVLEAVNHIHLMRTRWWGSQGSGSNPSDWARAIVSQRPIEAIELARLASGHIASVQDAKILLTSPDQTVRLLAMLALPDAQERRDRYVADTEAQRETLARARHARD